MNAGSSVLTNGLSDGDIDDGGDYACVGARGICLNFTVNLKVL